MNIELEVKGKLLPIAANLGFEIVSVAYFQKDMEYCLRIYLDKEGGVTTEDCFNFLRASGALINEIKPAGAFEYEVCAYNQERIGVKDLHTEIVDRFVCGNDAVNTYKLWYFFSDSDKPVLLKPLAGEDLKRETSDKNRYVANILPSSIFI